LPIEDKPDWVARARELAPMVESAADRTEKERRIPADVLAAMHDAGLFHILLPVSLGGAAADLVTFNQVIETIAAADASPAWCLAQAVASSHSAGFLDPKIAREVFGARDALVAWGPPAGIAKAVAVAGGYRVTGKWRFASGSANATWMGGHSTVFEADDRQRRDANGNPVNRTALFRPPSRTLGTSSVCAEPRATIMRCPSCSCVRNIRLGATPRRTGARAEHSTTFPCSPSTA
jgi:alkylation response protein AidB-like acyl-CoA dehydrogenase